MIIIITNVEYLITSETTKVYPFNFDYLKKEFVKVAMRDALTGVLSYLTFGVDYKVINKTIELLPTVTPIVDNKIRIERKTSTTEKIVTYIDASVLKAQELDLSQLQQLHILEELNDYIVENSMTVDLNGLWDAHGKRITNLGTPVDPNDAITKAYMETVGNGFVVLCTSLKNQTETYRDEALVSSQSASASALLAESWAVGDISSRPEGSSKYWAESAEDLTKGNLFVRKDGSTPMDNGYVPTVSLDVTTKDYVDIKTDELASDVQQLTKDIEDVSKDIEDTANSIVYPEGFVDYGRKITNVVDDVITISQGRDLIGNKGVSFLENTLIIPPRSTNLIADKKDGTTVLVPATYPEAYIDNNTVGFWKFNTTGNIVNSAIGISSTAVANDLVPTGGITSVDGWCDYASRQDGTSGFYTSQNSTGIPIGASAREINVMFTLNSVPMSDSTVLAYGSNRLDILVDSTSTIGVVFGSTAYMSGFKCDVGKTYKVTIKYNGTVAYLYINGVLIYQLSITLATTATSLYVGKRIATGSFGVFTFHYLEVRNAIRTDELTGQIANKLCLPCAYAKADGTRANITEILPADSVSLGIVRGDTTGVISYNDSEYQYGRREGAYGGNRRLFLGWKAFSGQITLTWDNPFGTRKVRLQAVWAQDSKGTNECDCATRNDTSTVVYGVDAKGLTTFRVNYVITAGGATNFNGAWQTSGYIGVYAEVLE